jgi:hypothetical protein
MSAAAGRRAQVSSPGLRRRIPVVAPTLAVRARRSGR